MKPTLIALAALGAAAGVHAAPSETLDPVVVTATRSPQRLSEVIADLTVITREDIERLGAGGLAELLRRSAGVQFARNGGPAAATSLYLRGAETRHSVLLVDGQRLDSQATGGPSWAGVPLAEIERIEILQGPASALYGSDAIGGVVQVFTRTGRTGLQGELALGAGSQGLRQAEASLRGGAGPLTLSLGVANERADGFNVGTDPKSFAWSPDRDGWRKASQSLRAGLALPQQHRLDASWMSSTVKSQFDGFDPGADDRDRQRSDTRSVRWQAPWSPALRTELQLGEGRERYDIPNFFYVTETRVSSRSLLAFWQAAPGWQWQAQLESQRDELRSDDLPGGRSERDQQGLGLGLQQRSGGFSHQFHLRREHNSAYGDATTWLAGAAWRVSASQQLALSAGSAFRAPTLYQLGSPYGVASLRPERARNVEGALRWREGDASASLTVYRNRVNQLIAFGAAGPCASRFGCYQNVASATLRGVSLKGATRAAGLDWHASVDLARAVDDLSGKDLPRRARRQAELGVDGQWGDLGAGAALHVAATRFDNAANTRALAGYALLDLHLRWQMAREWQWVGTLANAFDRDHALAAGYRGTPRTALLRLQWTPAP